MNLRLALCALGALTVAGAPALALAQDAAAPAATPPAKAAHHAKKKTAHHKAAATTGATGVTTVKAKK